jgi:hypothetical protein
VDDKPYYVPEVETHLLNSEVIDQVFKIQVMQPLVLKHAQERFPVLYLTDGNYSFDFAKGISHCLQRTGEVARYILVGIGYPGENPFAGSVLRCRDFTPADRPEVAEWRRPLPVDGVPDIESGKRAWGGADAFLDFIDRELSAFVDTRYSTIPGERSYFGHSLGGGLGLHALFSRTTLFSGYVISSPGLHYDGKDLGIAAANAFVASGESRNAKVVLTVGGEEEFEADKVKSHFVSSFFRLAALLQGARVSGMEFSYRLFPGETHASVWPIAFSHGVRALFGPADKPPLRQRQ